MPYIFTIHTAGYQPFRWSEKSLDGRRKNAVLAALDGLKFREQSLKALSWRIGFFFSGPYEAVADEDHAAYNQWLARRRNTLRFYDPVSYQWQEIYAVAPGRTKNCKAGRIKGLIDAVIWDGCYRLPFSAIFDKWHYSYNLDACYCEIRKI